MSPRASDILYLPPGGPACTTEEMLMCIIWVLGTEGFQQQRDKLRETLPQTVLSPAIRLHQRARKCHLPAPGGAACLGQLKRNLLCEL